MSGKKFFNKKYKLAIIAPVPFYYHIPFYYKINSSLDIDLTVYYCSNETLSGQEVEKTYKTKGNIVNKEFLLTGYNYKFLKNYSPDPSFLKWPFGLINFDVWKEIKYNKYDAVVLQSWTNFTWWLAFLACLKFQTPVFFMTDSNVLSETVKPSWKIFLKKKIIGNFLFGNASGFLTSGTANENFYKYYGVSKENITRVPFSWGYEWFLEQYDKLKSKKQEIRESFGVSKKDFILLYIGRLSKEKLPLVLLEAYDKVKVENKKLFIVGDGPMRKEVEEKIKSLKIKNVFLMGFQPREKISNYCIASDVFILPSEHETWGIVVNEAMCFGLPILVSDRVGSGIDLVKDGYNGFVFKNNNINDIVDAIEKIIKMPKQKRLLFGERSHEIIKEWIRHMDPVSQMKKAMKVLLCKRKKY